MDLWLSFSGQAQTRIAQDLSLLRYDRIVGSGAANDLQAWFQNEVRLETVEYLDEWWFFDQIMLIADRNNALLIDLSGDLTIKDEEIEDDTAIAFADVSGIAGDVEFHMSESATGRWRIETVSVPGTTDGPASWPGD